MSIASSELKSKPPASIQISTSILHQGAGAGKHILNSDLLRIQKLAAGELPPYGPIGARWHAEQVKNGVIAGEAKREDDHPTAHLIKDLHEGVQSTAKYTGHGELINRKMLNTLSTIPKTTAHPPQDMFKRIHADAYASSAAAAAARKEVKAKAVSSQGAMAASDKAQAAKGAAQPAVVPIPPTEPAVVPLPASPPQSSSAGERPARKAEGIEVPAERIPAVPPKGPVRSPIKELPDIPSSSEKEVPGKPVASVSAKQALQTIAEHPSEARARGAGISETHHEQRIQQIARSGARRSPEIQEPEDYEEEEMHLSGTHRAHESSLHRSSSSSSSFSHHVSSSRRETSISGPSTKELLSTSMKKVDVGPSGQGEGEDSHVEGPFKEIRQFLGRFGKSGSQQSEHSGYERESGVLEKSSKEMQDEALSKLERRASTGRTVHDIHELSLKRLERKASLLKGEVTGDGPSENEARRLALEKSSAMASGSKESIRSDNSAREHHEEALHRLESRSSAIKSGSSVSHSSSGYDEHGLKLFDQRVKQVMSGSQSGEVNTRESHGKSVTESKQTSPAGHMKVETHEVVHEDGEGGKKAMKMVRETVKPPGGEAVSKTAMQTIKEVPKKLVVIGLNDTKQALSKKAPKLGSHVVTDSSVHYHTEVMVDGKPHKMLVDTGSAHTVLKAGKTEPSSKTGAIVSVKHGEGALHGEESQVNMQIPGAAVKSHNVAVINAPAESHAYDGVLGLGPAELSVGTHSENEQVKTFAETLGDEGHVEDNAYGLYFEPTSASSAEEGMSLKGEISWDAEKSDKYVGTITYANITEIVPAGLHWGIDLSVDYDGTALLKKAPGILDQGASNIMLASDTFKAYKACTGAELDADTGLLYIPEEKFGSLKSLVFTIAGRKFELTPNAQIWPRHHNENIGGIKGRCYLIVHDMGLASGKGLDFVLGYTWLQRFYTIFDHANCRIGVAETKHTTAECN